ncbi:MAG: hypothetical protein ACFFF9_05675 [Candidatus Thorarchaeota archaeon]
MKECESCGAKYEVHGSEEVNLCHDCRIGEQIPLKKSILEFWKKRASWASREEKA